MKVLENDKFNFEQNFPNKWEPCFIPNDSTSCIENIKNWTCKCAIAILEWTQQIACQKPSWKLWYGPLSQSELDLSTTGEDWLVTDDFAKKYKETWKYITNNKEDPQPVIEMLHKLKDDWVYLFSELWRNYKAIKFDINEEKSSRWSE